MIHILWKDLFFKINNYIKCSVNSDSSSLLDDLQMHKTFFLNFLHYSPKNVEDRRSVEMGNFEDSILHAVLKLSDTLDLNELDSLEIIKKALEEDRYIDYDLYDIAEFLLFECRKYFLNCLNLLFSSRSDPSIVGDTQQVVQQFTNQLLSEHFSETVIKYIENSIDLSTLESYCRSFRSRERDQCAELLFSIYSTSASTDYEAISVMELTHRCTSHLTHIVEFRKQVSLSRREGWTNQMLEEGKRKVLEENLFNTCSLLTLTIVGMLNRSQEVDVNKCLNLGVLNYFAKDFNSRNIGECNDYLRDSKGWDSRFHGILLLAWSLYLYNLRTTPYKGPEVQDNNLHFLVYQAINKDVWESLDLSLCNWRRLDSPNVDLYAKTLDQLFSNFLSHLNHVAIEMKMEECTLRPEAGRRRFTSLMRFVTKLYKPYPSLSLKFWESGPPFVFLRSAGETIPPHLEIPYMEMIASLASGPENAWHAFAFLKNFPSPHIHWDAFFRSLQRLDIADVGLAVLSVLEVIVMWNEELRNLIFQNKLWDVVRSLFSVLVSDFPIRGKTKVMKVIKGFTKSPEVVPQLWQWLESTQIIPVASDFLEQRTNLPKTFHQGIKFVLTELESREEEYPYTEEFLSLVHHLVLVFIPDDLGMEYRSPGIEPYLSFILEDVFLQFNLRGYKRPSEKWRIAHTTTSIFLGILQNWQLNSDHFSDREITVSGHQIAVPKPPGFSLMKNLLTSSNPFIKKIMWIINIGITENSRENLEDNRFIDENGHHYEGAVENCLKIVLLVLERQGEFLRLYQESGASLLVRPLHQILLMDRKWIFSISKYVGYMQNPSIALLSVNIMYQLSQQEGMTSEIVSIIQSANHQRAMITYYTNCLEPPEKLIKENSGEEGMGRVDDITNPTNSIHMAILQLLLSNLHHPFPNLTHLLLAFNLSLPPHETDLENTISVHPLKVLLSKMNSHFFIQQSPLLSEQCYQLVFMLCREQSTCSVVMSYLRGPQTNFYMSHMTLLNPSFIGENLHSQNMAAHLLCRGWLLKSIALELFVISPEEPRAARYLLDALFAARTSDSQPNLDGTSEAPKELPQKMTSLLTLLDVPLPQVQFVPPNLEEVRHFIDKCVYMDERQRPLLHLKDLRTLLVQAYTRLYGEQLSRGVPILRRHECHDAITQVLANAAEWNAAKHLEGALEQFFEGWQQLVSVTLMLSRMVSPTWEWEPVLFDLLEALLEKLRGETPQLSRTLFTAISGTVMRVMAKQREHKYYQYSRILHVRDAEDIAEGKYLPVERFRRILEGILRGLSKPDSDIEARGNLYGALLHYLNITQRPVQHMLLDQSDLPKTALALLAQHIEKIENQWQTLARNTLQLLKAGGEELILKIARDTAPSSGPLWAIAIAFSTLDILLRYDSSRIVTLSKQGYLRNWLDEIAQQDEAGVLEEIHTEYESGEIYVYESKISMLTRMAETKRGANILLENGLVTTFTKCDFMNLWPGDSMVENEVEQNDLLQAPVLRLVSQMMTSLPNNPTLTFQVMGLIENHRKLFVNILKDRVSFITLSSIKQLQTVTSIFYHLARNQTAIPQSLQQRFTRFQDLILPLLLKYGSSEKWISLLRPVKRQEKKNSKIKPPLSTKDTSNNTKKYLNWSVFLQDSQNGVFLLLRNILGLIRLRCLPPLTVSATSPYESGTPKYFTDRIRILLTPAMAQDHLSTPQTGHHPEPPPESPTGSVLLRRAPSLGLLVAHLRYYLEHLADTLDIDALALDRLGKPTLEEEELQEVLQNEYSVSKSWGSFQKLKFAHWVLSTARLQFTEKKNTLLYLIENTLFLIYIHLEVFLNKKFFPDVEKEENTRSPTTHLSEPLSPEQQATLRRAVSETLIRDETHTLDRILKLPGLGEPNVTSILVTNLKNLIDK